MAACRRVTSNVGLGLSDNGLLEASTFVIRRNYLLFHIMVGHGSVSVLPFWPDNHSNIHSHFCKPVRSLASIPFCNGKSCCHSLIGRSNSK